MGLFAAAGEGGEVEVTVVGWLVDGREFYGMDTIKVKTGIKERRRIRQVQKLGRKLNVTSDDAHVDLRKGKEE